MVEVNIESNEYFSCKYSSSYHDLRYPIHAHIEKTICDEACYVVCKEVKIQAYNTENKQNVMDSVYVCSKYRVVYQLDKR